MQATPNVQQALDMLAAFVSVGVTVFDVTFTDLAGEKTGFQAGRSFMELRQTMMIAVPLTEASAKIRTGGPVDDEEDYAMPIWAGVLPLALTPQPPVPDERLDGDRQAPEYVSRYSRPGK